MANEPKPELIHTPTLGTSGVLSLPDMGRPNYNGPPQACNFDIKTPSGARRFLTAAGKTKLLASDLGGEVFEMVHWLCEPATFAKEGTEELTTGCRVTLWDRAEKRLTCTSWDVVRFLDRIVKCMGPGPWTPPIGLSIKNTVERGSGKRGYDVEMVELPEIDLPALEK